MKLERIWGTSTEGETGDGRDQEKRWKILDKALRKKCDGVRKHSGTASARRKE